MDTDKIKKFFTWIFALIGLVMMIIGSVGLLNIGLKKYVFTKADHSYCIQALPAAAPDGKSAKTVPDQDAYLKNCKEQQDSQRQRDMAQDVALLIIGAPIFLGFFRKTKE